MSGSASKPKETIQISIKGQSGEQIQFRVRKSTAFSKVFKAYGKRQGAKPETFKFQYDGEIIDPS